MALLIDGYNLMHAADMAPRGSAPGALERSRNRLLALLAASIPAAQYPVTVVFDAARSPRNSSSTLRHGELIVRYSIGYDTADELIEELIRLDSAPKKLLVVSSDHRIQKAAKRRRAEAIDSDPWLAELLAERRSGQAPPAAAKNDAAAKPTLSEGDVARWMREFDVEGMTDPDAIFPPGYGADMDDPDLDAD